MTTADFRLYTKFRMRSEWKDGIYMYTTTSTLYYEIRFHVYSDGRSSKVEGGSKGWTPGEGFGGKLNIFAYLTVNFAH